MSKFSPIISPITLDLNSNPKIGFISLGCSKALVDSEEVLTQLIAEGYEISKTYDDADLVVVNTCGFIDDAIKESLDIIGEALKKNGKVIVIGCLGAKKDSSGSFFVKTIHPKVLSVLGPNSVNKVMDAIHYYLPKPHDPHVDLVPNQGIKLTPSHYSYFKISEGCNNKCSFCIIPSMRGKLVSRPFSNLMNEAENLFKSGVKELLVISQDTSAYGSDLKFKTSFWNGMPIKTNIYHLVRSLGILAKNYNSWVRLHYVYPYPHVDSLVSLMNDNNIVPYLDVPLQHADYNILKKMKRPAFVEKNIERIKAWRKICPEITIRSTFITGFPGETEREFENLLEFLQEVKIDRLGCFVFSPVKGAKANLLSNHVPKEIGQQRKERVMKLQEKISRIRLQSKIGTYIRVLIDKVDGSNYICRSTADSPEIDGQVYVHKPYNPKISFKVGEFIDVKVSAADDHDLWASLD